MTPQGIPINSLAQAVSERHFHDFDLLIGMDANNVRNLQSMKPRNGKATSACDAKLFSHIREAHDFGAERSRLAVKLFGEYGDNKPIQDPYYGGRSGFETTYKQVLAYSEGLLADLGLAGEAA